MADVRMPDGVVVRFPDDMPPEQIRAMILQKFPDAGQGTQPKPTHQGGDWGPPGILAPVQFQEGTGQMRPAIPQVLTDAWDAIQAPGRAATGQYDQLEVNTATGAVSPFDPRMMDDAANLASMVTPVSAASRIGAPTVRSASSAVKTALPGIDDLYVAKDAAYEFADKLGARYSAQAVDELSGDMIRRAVERKFNPRNHPGTAAFLDELGAQPQPMTLTQLDQMRQFIRRDLVKPDGPDADFGKQFISAIDDFIDNATPGKISGVQGETAAYAIRTARNANKTLRRSETVQEILDNARLSAAASGSGGNIDNSIRQGFARVLKSDKLSMGFSKDELAAMEKIVMGGKGQNALRLLGKLSPSGNGLMAALSLGATAANPAMAIAPAAGLVAKTLADRATTKGVSDLTRTVRTGGKTGAPLKPLSPFTPKATTTLLEQNFGNRLPSLPRYAPNGMPII